jgi:hypothetical protein
MSTRATYKIGEQTFYIHHDGYESGAAEYFFNMVKESNRNIYEGTKHKWHAIPAGGYVAHFFRGNDRTELTANHGAHGDTEYRYTLDVPTMTINVQKRMGSWDDPVWSTNKIPVKQFINKHSGEQIYQTDNHLYTTKCLSDRIKREEKLLAAWLEREGDEHSANTKSLMETIAKLKKELFGL